MQNKRRFKAVVVAIVIFSMVTMYGAVPTAKAASLTNVKDILSNSAPTSTATHQVVFTSGIAIPNNGYYEIEMDPAFEAIGDTTDITCQGTGVESTSTPNTARCTYADGLVAGTTTTSIVGINNPSAGDYLLTITTYNASGVELESAQAVVYIIDSVTVTAHVDATLTFGIAGVASGQTVNGVTTTQTSSPTSTPFGTLDPLSSSTVAQTLAVSTNARYGYSVTVQKTSELVSAGGANINSFDNALDGEGLATPKEWEGPDGSLGNANTYGHFGLTTDDSALSGGADFTGSKFAGLAGVSPMQVMSHNGPVNGADVGVGTTTVAYKAQISALQEAGDYSTAIIYVCTPSY